MQSAQYWVEKLKLQSHPEGGYFAETYRSQELIAQACLPERYFGDRVFATQIYYLLKHDQKSLFHRVKSDETWHFYEGQPLALYMISPTGDFTTVTLGRGHEGFVFQYTVPQGYWFAATVEAESDFSLVGCTVAPGFHFDDFELADPQKLIAQFPEHRALIEFVH